MWRARGPLTEEGVPGVLGVRGVAGWACGVLAWGVLAWGVLVCGMLVCVCGVAGARASPVVLISSPSGASFSANSCVCAG